MKTNWQDPQTSEIRSTHIAGLIDAVGKIEDVLDLQLQAETGVPLTEVYISEQDRYRIYQAPAGKRNWASSPAPVIKKNGIVISSGFTIDYGGGAIIVSPSATSTDTFTADVSYTKTTDNALARHLAETAYQSLSVTRDGQTSGVQTITGLLGKPKKIEIRAVINGTHIMSMGSWEESGSQGSIYQYAANSFSMGGNQAVNVFKDGVNGLLGVVQNVVDGSFEINWTLGGTGVTGTIIVHIMCCYHGGV